MGPYFTLLGMVYAGFFAATISPGPSFALILSQSMERRANGVAAAIGITTGSVAWCLFAVSGVAALVAASPQLAYGMRFVCGGYLLWLGLQSLRKAWRGGVSTILAGAQAEKSLSASFRKAVMIHLTNPKAALFWVSITAVAMTPDIPFWFYVALVVGVAAIGLAWNLSLALLFSVDRARTRYAKMQRPIALVFGVIFMGFGLRLILG